MIHLIFSRFNVGLFNRNDVKIEEWTRHRTVLFERYCLPSLRQQSCKKFQLVIFYDANSKKQDDYGYSSYGVTERTFEQAVRAVAHKMYKEGELFITTRLDNDDALHKDYVKRVQEIAREVDGKGVYGINFSSGYCYKHGGGDVTLIENDYGTTFISVVSWSKDVTVHNWPNTRIPQSIPTIQDAKPMWCRIIHDRNVSNTMEGKPITKPDMKEFF